MMRRKLQTVGWIAALLCCAVLWTTPAMAEEVKYELWIAGKQVTSENCTNISKDNGFDGVTIAEGGKFSYDKANNKLLMKDVAVDSKELDAIKHQIVNLTIEVEGTNTFNAEGRAAGLRCLASTKLEGRGSLTITVKGIGIFLGVANTELSISDITLNTSGQYGISGDGASPQKLTINNAIVIAKGELRAMDALADLSLSNCAIVTPEVSKFESGSIIDINTDEWATKVEIAPTYDLYIAGKLVHALNCQHIDSEHGFDGVTVAEGGECRYDKEKNTLFMTSVTIEPGDDKSAIANYIEHLKFQVEGKNYWKTTNRSAFFNCGEFTDITGEEGKASLEVTSRDSAAVFVHKTAGVNNIEFTATGKWGVLGKDRNDWGCCFSLHSAKGKITATSTEEEVSAIMDLYSLNDEDMLYLEPRRAICLYEQTVGALIYTEGPNNGKKIKALTFDRKYGLNITTGRVDVENCNNIPADPQFKYITVAQGGHLYYKHDIKTLFMKDVTIEEPDQLTCAITNLGIEGLTIHLEGNNVWSVRQNGIQCDASTKITGNGTLTLTIKPNLYALAGFYIQPNSDHPNITVDISDITIEAHTPHLLHSDHSQDQTGNFILNNVKATVHDGALKDCDCTFKGCKVVSKEGESPIVVDRILVESVAFDPKEITRYVGDAPVAVPQPTVNPEDAGNKRMKWTSDNEEVAKVNEEGMLIIGKKGTAHLIAKTTDGSNQEATLTVQVRYRVDGVKLFQNDQEVSAITVTEGAPFTLTAKVVPETTPGGVEWEFQAEEFTVTDKTTEKATFTALKTGDYTLTAKAVEDNTKTAMVNVKVLLATPTAIAIAEAEKNFELKKDESKEITLNFTPAEHVNKEVNVTVAPKEALAASVTDGKLTIKADKPFDKDTQVTVTVTSKVAPTVSASCTVTLKYEKPGAVEDVALESMVVAPNPFTSQLRISNPEGVEARYELVNTIGVVVRKGALQSVETVLNTENLNAGVYLLRLLSGTSSKTLRMVKE